MGNKDNSASSTILEWTEQGRVPDAVIRAGIRRLCRQRLKDIEAFDIEASARRVDEFVRLMNSGPIAPVPELANEQHYEVPAAFFEQVLGRHLKYSSCYWPEGTRDLDRAEEQMKELGDPGDMFEHAFARMPAYLKEQKEAFADEMAEMTRENDSG